MPRDSAELPMYLDNVDNLFSLYDVPNDLKSRLLLAHLTGKAKSIVSKLSLEQLADYDAVKRFLLTEFSITPRELRARFVSATKKSDESYAVFRGRLELILAHYLRARGADTLEKVVDLLISDKLKDSLPVGSLRYVLGLEGNKCFTSHEIANAADVYGSNYNADGSYKANSVSNLPLHSFNDNNKVGKFSRPYVFKSHASGQNSKDAGAAETPVKPSENAAAHVASNGNGKPAGSNGKVFVKRATCYICKSDQHLIANCPKKSTSANPRANSCTTEPVAKAVAVQPISSSQTEAKTTADCSAVNCERLISRAVFEMDSECGYDVHNFGRSDVTVIRNDAPISSGVPECVDAKVFECTTPLDVKLSPLHYIDVVICGHTYKALIDSGAEIPLIKSQLVDDISYVGTINIQPIVGKPVPAKLAVLDVVKFDSNESLNGQPQGDCRPTKRPLHLVFAVTDLAGHDVILPASVVQDLQGTSHKCTDVICQDTTATLNCVSVLDRMQIEAQASVSVSSNAALENVTNDESNDVANVDLFDASDVNELDNFNSSREQLIKEQMSDTSLKSCRSLADRKKGGYRWINGILYHSDTVLNQSVLQLVAPVNRRNDIMAFAHDKTYHQGHKKTNERIRYSFYWPTLRSDVIKYVATCESCILKRRLVTKDRVPIAPIERPGLPGQQLIMDIIGPIEPASSMGHKYILNVICLHSRWPFSYVLRNISAASVCDCLCDVFSNIGVASIISSDCGSNFTSQLTKTFLERMGCTPRFNSPAHPEASGAVERLNQTFKRMLHHAITRHSRQWHKCIPFILWALRESGNTTTGLPPYTLLYGHLPRGPLHILKESWTGEKPLPTTLQKSEIEYMLELKKHLDTVKTYADSHSEQAQAAYVCEYNKRAKDKSFEIGEKVIVLFPDSTSKLRSKWQTGNIVDIYDEYSYLVEMTTGARKQIHANHLRPFLARVSSVIADNDVDFGDVFPLPNNHTEMLPSQRIDKAAISHLAETEQKQLLDLLDEYADCFSDKPGLCNVVQHDIVTLPGFAPKRLKPYKIPESLKPEVEKQIDALLKDGIIVPSSSPMISPIVCIVKHSNVKPGSMQVRIACDYRYLNSFTQFDPFPVGDPDDVMNTLASFNIISVFDAKAGYWQTLVKPSCRWLLAFATHHGIWEWNRTPFGAKNSGSTFIRAIQHVLKPVRDIATNYVDDMGVGSHTWIGHLINLRRFFDTIKAAGVTLNLQKSEFAKPFVKFVGHIVGCNMKYADPAKIQAIQAITRPTTQRQLKSFLGMLAYHRAYIAHFSDMAKPLTDLTSSKYSKQLPWSQEHETSFCALKSALCSLVGLTVPRIGGLFILRTDASNYAISGCLYQRDDDNIDNVQVTGVGEKPIYFFSQKLNRPQIAWSVIEKEAYAVIASLRKLHHIVFGSQIVVFSDHNPLSYLVSCVTQSAKLMRWSLALQQYNIVFRFLKSSNNSVADFFSRYTAEAAEDRV
jgi:hypothetical protein